jgi:hypothetical protein
MGNIFLGIFSVWMLKLFLRREAAMKLLIGLGLILVVLTGCNQTDTSKNQLKDNNINTTNVADKGNIGKGQKYGGKGTGYGQVKKIEPGQAVPPLVEAPPVVNKEETILKALEQYQAYKVAVANNQIVIEFHKANDKAVIEIAIENALGGNVNFINWYEAGGYPATYMKMIYEINEIDTFQKMSDWCKANYGAGLKYYWYNGVNNDEITLTFDTNENISNEILTGPEGGSKFLEGFNAIYGKNARGYSHAIDGSNWITIYWDGING